MILKHVGERDITKSAMQNLRSNIKRMDKVINTGSFHINISRQTLQNLNSATKRIKTKSYAEEDDEVSSSKTGMVVGLIFGVVATIGLIIVIRMYLKMRGQMGEHNLINPL